MFLCQYLISAIVFSVLGKNNPDARMPDICQYSELDNGLGINIFFH